MDTNSEAQTIDRIIARQRLLQEKKTRLMTTTAADPSCNTCSGDSAYQKTNRVCTVRADSNPGPKRVIGTNSKKIYGWYTPLQVICALPEDVDNSVLKKSNGCPNDCDKR